MKRLRSFGWFALVLLGAWIACAVAPSQSLAPADDRSPGMHELPPKPGGGPDPYAQFKTDPLSRRALREQARLNAQLRQKQLLDATELLLKIARDLRAEMAANPDGIPNATETERLQQIQKLAHVIQDREKSEDQATESLAKSAVSQ
jgi:hypothetical protein